MPDQFANLAAATTDRYRLVRELGQGGMATVYLAEDVKHHRQVAIKMLRPELAASLGAERFLREIEIAAGLHHPHILPLYDSGGSGDVLYYVMPFVDGQSLRDRLAKVGALPIDEAVRILREVTDALAYSHQRGVVHRDIKPENIMISGSHALVTDFGIAKALSDASSTAHITSTGMALGTPTYMAPEQVTADPSLDHRVDIYAVGVMAYEILAGRAPFLGTNPQQVLAGHLTRAPEALSIHRSTVPAALEAIVMRCLEKNASDRWQTAGELLRALEGLSANSGAVVATGANAGTVNAATASQAGLRAGRQSTSRRGRVIGAAVATLALVAGGLFWYQKDGRAGTLIGRDVLATNDLVLVSDFQNRTPDSTLAPTVTDAVRVELQQSKVVHVMSQAAMFSALERMRLPKGSALPTGKVQDLAEREGAKAFVTGEIARVGGGYQLTARVVATAGGADVFTTRATAADDGKLIGAIEELGRDLRRGIGESLRSVASTPPLAQVTTASLSALRLYTVASRDVNSGEPRRAIDEAKEALQLDSAFASAWSVLYVAYANTSSLSLQDEAATQLFALRDRLTEAQALRATATYHGMRGEYNDEEAAWQRLVEQGRDHTNYANMLLKLRRLSEAEAMQKRGIVAEPKLAIGYWNLVEAQVAQQHFAAAESTVTLMRSRAPESTLQRQTTLAPVFGRRDFDVADSMLKSPDFASFKAKRPDYACMVALQRGRLSGLSRCPSRLAESPFAALVTFRLTGDSLRARRASQPFLDSTASARGLDGYADNIALLAEVGRVKEARAVLDEFRSRTKSVHPTFRSDSAFAVGSLAAAEGQWDRAATAFLAWNADPMPSSKHLYNRGLPEAAAVLARAGRNDSAVVLLERALRVSSTAGGVFYESSWYAHALQQLGDAYDARGDRAKATGYYTKFVNLMRDADPPIAADVQLVKEKLGKLSGEPGPKPTKVGRP